MFAQPKQNEHILLFSGSKWLNFGSALTIKQNCLLLQNPTQTGWAGLDSWTVSIPFQFGVGFTKTWRGRAYFPEKLQHSLGFACYFNVNNGEGVSKIL